MLRVCQICKANFLNYIFANLVCVYVFVYGVGIQVGHSAHVEVQGQLAGVSPLLLPYRSQG